MPRGRGRGRCFGAWTAHLSRRRRTGDADRPIRSGQSSRQLGGDHSRILRCGCGADEIYSGFARRSLISGERWTSARGHRSGTRASTAAGGGRRPVNSPPDRRSGGRLRDRGARRLRLRVRYPHLDASDVAMALLEPECGVLMARRAVRTLVELVQSGTEYLRGQVDVVPSPGHGEVAAPRRRRRRARRRLRLRLRSLAAVGLRATLDGLIRPTRQNVIYFGAPPGDEPLRACADTGVDRSSCRHIRHPDLEDCGVKVGIDEHGPPIDQTAPIGRPTPAQSPAHVRGSSGGFRR